MDNKTVTNCKIDNVRTIVLNGTKYKTFRGYRYMPILEDFVLDGQYCVPARVPTRDILGMYVDGNCLRLSLV